MSTQPSSQAHRGAAAPLVSVVTATYNRSNVLRCALQSVRASTFPNWELIAVGDACTDDSAAVVEALGDPRIRFVNLAENFGDQSGPNNVGAALARGAYIAYLNHDDLYFPDHLATAVAALEASGADMVHTAAIEPRVAGQENRDLASMRYVIGSISDRPGYNPLLGVKASTWLIRRELVQSVGPWLPATACYSSSSQEWLFRAWKAGHRIVSVPRVTVLVVVSVLRREAYRLREGEDNRWLLEQMARPDFRERILERAAIGAALERELFRLSPRHHTRRMGQALLQYLGRVLLRVGYPPREFMRRMGFFRRGAYIQHLRRLRGLPPIDFRRQRRAAAEIEQVLGAARGHGRTENDKR